VRRNLGVRACDETPKSIDRRESGSDRRRAICLAGNVRARRLRAPCHRSQCAARPRLSQWRGGCRFHRFNRP